MAKEPWVTKWVEDLNELRKKDPAEAARQAQEGWDGHFNTINDLTRADAVCELVYAELVARRDAIKRSTLLKDVVEQLNEAARTLTNIGPIADTSEEALTRGNYWDNSFEGKEIQLIVLQEVIFLLDLVQSFSSNLDVSVYYSGVLYLLEQVYKETPEETFGYIFTIKHSNNYEEVITAYEKYIELAASQPETSKEEIEYISNLVLAWAIRKADVLRIQSIQKSQHWSLKHAIISGVKTVGKQISTKLIQTGWKIQFGLSKRGASAHELQSIRSLTRMQFVGLGEGRVEKISDQF